MIMSVAFAYRAATWEDRRMLRTGLAVCLVLMLVSVGDRPRASPARHGPGGFRVGPGGPGIVRGSGPRPECLEPHAHQLPRRFGLLAPPVRQHLENTDDSRPHDPGRNGHPRGGPRRGTCGDSRDRLRGRIQPPLLLARRIAAPDGPRVGRFVPGRLRERRLERISAPRRPGLVRPLRRLSRASRS